MYDRDDNLFVPIDPTRLSGVVSIRTARLPQGEATGLAFSSAEKLIGAMGDHQGWTCLSESALRSYLRPLGLFRIQVDAERVGGSVTPLPALARRSVQRFANPSSSHAAVA